jgi:ribonuclease D
MRNYLLATALALSSMLALAQSSQAVDVSKLTPEQQKAVQAVANQMAEKRSDAPAILQAIQNLDSSKIRGWAEAGTEAGKAVGNFAKEVAIPANAFLDSSVGKATFFLVFMNYGGGQARTVCI